MDALKAEGDAVDSPGEGIADDRNYLVFMDNARLGGGSILIAITAIALLVAAAHPVAAHEAIASDPADSAGPLDLSKVVHRHVAHHPNRLVFKAKTFETWRPRLLRRRSGMRRWISFEIDLGTAAGLHGERERRVFAFYQNGRLRARMYGSGYGDPAFMNAEVIGDVRVRRPSRRTVRIQFRQTMLGSQANDGYRWLATSSYEAVDDENCAPPVPHGDGGYGTCTDFSTYMPRGV